MFFVKKNDLIGLDIGSTCLKATELLKTKTGYKLKRVGFLDIPPGLIENGIIQEPLEVAELIRKLMKECRIKNCNVAISVGGYSVIVKKLVLQNVPNDKLDEAITFEAEQYIPFNIEDVDLDYEIIGEDETNPNNLNILMVAGKKDFINDYINVVQMAGLNPCVVDVDAFALQNIFEISYDSSENIFALIDIGAYKTSLSIMKNNSSVFMRDVPLGCGQVNEQIASIADCSVEEAEQIKKNETPDVISDEELKNIIASVSAGWCAEIKRALDFYYSSNPDDIVKKIIISGGGANIHNFCDLLAYETSAEVEVINPFANIEIDDGIDSSFLQQIAPQLAICMGLSLRKVDDK